MNNERDRTYSNPRRMRSFFSFLWRTFLLCILQQWMPIPVNIIDTNKTPTIKAPIFGSTSNGGEGVSSSGPELKLG